MRAHALTQKFNLKLVLVFALVVISALLSVSTTFASESADKTIAEASDGDKKITSASSIYLQEFLKIKTMTASFEQENHYPGIDTYTMHGKLHISRPEIAIWDYQDPVEFYLLKKDSMQHYSELLNQLLTVSIDIEDTDDPSGLMLAIFLDSSNIDKLFNITEKDSVVTLSPKTVASINPIIMTFDSKNIIKSVSTSDSADTKITITFQNVEVNKAIDRGAFIKAIPDGTDIVSN